jgi:alpha-methylacyl-CoA racemase
MALRGIKVLEMAGLAPVPYATQVLRDYGAEVIRIDRAGVKFNMDQQSRGKSSIAINMKHPDGQGLIQKLAEKCDVIVDPFRPGVMERLNCGPENLLEINKKLIYARLSGFGQNGPLKFAPGHDINYIAQSGVLNSLRDDRGKPTPPINLVADFAGGGILLATGVIAALFERTSSHRGNKYIIIQIIY